jgi:hypothetical protein
LSAALAFVSFIVRTPLRWVLGGPVRAEQRKRIDAVSAGLTSRLNGDGADPGGGGHLSDGASTGGFDPPPAARQAGGALRGG